MKVLLNCDVDWAWRMWGMSPFLKELDKECESVLLINKKNETDYNDISFPSDIRRYQNKHDNEIPDDKKKDIREFLKKSLEDIDVVLLASAGERFVNLELIKLCKELGKKSIFMVEGLNNADYGIPVWPDKIFVWGQAMYELFSNYVKNTGPCPKKKLIITGQPRFDNFYGLYRPNPSYNTVMVAPPYYNAEYAEDTADLIMGGLKDFDGLVMVHPHPSIGTDLYRDMNDKHREQGAYISKDSLKEFWQLADVCITAASTIAVEAMCFDIPVIIADRYGLIDKQRHFYQLLKSGAYIKVKDYKGVKEAVKQSFKYPDKYSDKRKKVVENYLYKFDGNSSKRCVEAIKEVYNE